MRKILIETITGILRHYRVKNIGLYEPISKLGREYIFQKIQVIPQETTQKIRKPFQTIIPKIYFVNFELLETEGLATRVVGSIISPHFISIGEAKELVKKYAPKGWTFINYYEAEEEGTHKETIMTIIRDDEEIFSKRI